MFGTLSRPILMPLRSFKKAGRLVEDACQTPLADESLKKVFKDWTYTTEIVDGSYVIVHKTPGRVFSWLFYFLRAQEH